MMYKNDKKRNWKARASRREAFLLGFTVVAAAIYAVLAIAAGQQTPAATPEAQIVFATISAWALFLLSVAHVIAQYERFVNHRKDDDYGWGGLAQIFLAYFLYVMGSGAIYWVMWVHNPDAHWDGVSSADACWSVAVRMLSIGGYVAGGVGFTSIVPVSEAAHFVPVVLGSAAEVFKLTVGAFGITFVVERALGSS